MSHTTENDGILPRPVSGDLVVPRLLPAAVEACAEGVFLVDMTGICGYANAAATAIVGCRIDQLVGQHLHSLVHHSREDGSPYPAEECPIISAATAGSSADSHDEVLWCADGVGIAVDLRARPVRLEGVLAGAVVTVTDARTRRAAVELAQTNEQRFRRQFDHAPVGLALAELDEPSPPSTRPTARSPAIRRRNCSAGTFKSSPTPKTGRRPSPRSSC